MLVPKIEEAKHVVELYRLRAENVLSDEQIIKKINAMGYRSRMRIKRDKLGVNSIGTSGERKLDEQQMHNILRHPTYAGIICKKWTRYQPIKAMFEGLVDIETWNKANRGKIYIKKYDDGTYEILKNYDEKKQVKTKVSDVYPYKHVIMCPKCNIPFWASGSTGRKGGKFPLISLFGQKI